MQDALDTNTKAAILGNWGAPKLKVPLFGRKILAEDVVAPVDENDATEVKAVVAKDDNEAMLVISSNDADGAGTCGRADLCCVLELLVTRRDAHAH